MEILWQQIKNEYSYLLGELRHTESCCQNLADSSISTWFMKLDWKKKVARSCSYLYMKRNPVVLIYLCPWSPPWAQVYGAYVGFNLGDFSQLTALVEHFFFFAFLGLHPRHMEVPRLEVKWDGSCQPMPQSQQCRTPATSETYTTVYGNTGSLTH